MARVNEHRMKLPIPYLHEKPDKDGKCRSEAEVDHIQAVKDGGNDHQSNLATICQDCHKKKHKKKGAGVERTGRVKKIEQPTNVISFESLQKNKTSKAESASSETDGLLATEKQLSYLEFLASQSGCLLQNRESILRSHASKLIGFFLRNSPVEESVLERHLIRRF